MAQKLTRLVAKAQKGNEKALNELIAQCYNDLYYFAYKTLKNEDLAKDITQESWIIILQKLSTLHDPGAFKSWARQIVYHQCAHHFRAVKEMQVPENEVGAASLFDTLADTDTSVMPETVAEDKEFQKIMQDLLNELPAEQRTALMLYYYEKMSVSEIASIQGVPGGTVKSRLNYGRKVVKNKVEEYEKASGIRLHSAAILPALLHLLFQTGKAETANAGVALAPGAVAGILGAAGVEAATGVGVKIAVAAGLLVTFGVIGGVVGNHIVSPSPPPTNPTIIATFPSSTSTMPTTQITTAPTTVPTTTPTTVYVHPGPENTDGELEYTPADIPEVYWKVLNNREPICFPEGCTTLHHRCFKPCYAWLDEQCFPYDFNELAAYNWVDYAVIDMDGDGSEELLIRGSDTFVLREKDGIVYGYSFIFRNMDNVYTDGSYSAYYGGGGLYYWRLRLSFDETGNYNEICIFNDYHDYLEDEIVDCHYYIQGIEVSEQEYLAYENTFTSEKVVWKKLDRYPNKEKEDRYPPG